jgi:hypothetical protein
MAYGRVVNVECKSKEDLIMCLEISGLSGGLITCITR